MIEFVQMLEFECIIFLDEAEKVFRNDDPNASQALLKMIDGITNKSRKLYLLTTNSLDINPNLLGRPGRIRYIHTFNNIHEEAVREYIKNNLMNKKLTDSVIGVVKSLKVSSIDTLRAVVDEANIHGEIEDNSDLNLEFIETNISIISIRLGEDDSNPELDEKRFQFLKEWIEKHSNGNPRPVTWALTTKWDDNMHPGFSFERDCDEFMDDTMKAEARRRGGRIEFVGLDGDKNDRYVSEYLFKRFQARVDRITIPGIRPYIGMRIRNIGTVTDFIDGWWYVSTGRGAEATYRFLC